jgi:hypothetical protein
MYSKAFALVFFFFFFFFFFLILLLLLLLFNFYKKEEAILDYNKIFCSIWLCGYEGNGMLTGIGCFICLLIYFTSPEHF